MAAGEVDGKTLDRVVDAITAMGGALDTRELLDTLVAAAGQLTTATHATVQILDADGPTAGGLARELVSWSAVCGAHPAGTAPARPAADGEFHLEQPLSLAQAVKGLVQLTRPCNGPGH